MSSNRSYFSLCDINDPSYLYSGSVFASITHAKSEDMLSNFNFCEAYPELQVNQLYQNCTYSDQKMINKVCEIPQSVDSNKLRTKNIRIDDSQIPSRGETKSCCTPTIPNKSSRSMKASKRRDVAYKSAIRLLRRFFKNTFKQKNKDIVKRRYYNCTMEYIYARVYDMLEELIPQEDLTKELVYYTIGIIDIRKDSESSYSNAIKRQITALKDCRQQFSRSRFNKAFMSKSLRALARCLVQNHGDPRVSIFKEELIKREIYLNCCRCAYQITEYL
ncbi:unnamed protein product [Moneuplotes crassus]|uniref:Uncharacterized protein n=1 Tax=Euplotes crassus TaxID=5936 RepID=A0AAD1Y406_EUPCR|nr:unnamed protein product [Moneuplotes crassus]